MAARGIVSTGSSLLNGLQVYYKLEDVNDSVGGLTLTNNGGVTFTAGKVNNAANFVSASNQWLSRADNAAFQMGTGDFTLAAWIKFTTNVTSDFVTYGNATGGASLGYAINQSGTKIGFTIGDGTHAAAKDNATVCNDGSWHLAIFTALRSAQGSIYIDNGASDSVDITSVGSVNNANGFAIGGGVGGIHLSDSSIDEVGLWNRLLTADERTALWNSGNGTTYPF